VWVQREGPASLFYSSAPAGDALAPQAWQPPRKLDISQPGTDGLRLRVDRSGNFHLLFRKPEGVFYTRSTDQALQWSAPLLLDTGRPQGYVSRVSQMELDGKDGLHAVWDHYDTVGRRVQYVRSMDAGLTWSQPLTLDEFNPSTDNPLTQSVGSPHGLVAAGDAVHVLWVGGPPGGPAGVGRKHRISPDRGATWGATMVSQMNGVWGAQNGEGFSVDAAGHLHWVGLARNWISQGKLWEGLWSSTWSEGAWSPAEQVVTVLPPGGDSARLASTPGGQLVAAFLNQPRPEALFATHTTGPYLYFPHYADGGGWSMQLVVNNFSATRAAGRLQVYDGEGKPQELPFEGGAASSVELDLQPYSTAVFRSLGSSAPMKTGYIRVEMDHAEFSGVAIFQNANGTEAGALPERFGRRLALLVERSASMQTGIAFARHTPSQPVTLRLFDLAGKPVETREYLGGTHSAGFVEEFFPASAPVGFRGMMLVESEAALSATGLRLGRGILSTLPVTDLDAIGGAGSYFFPHFADGGGHSMLLAISNLSGNAASGKLSVFGTGGTPREIAFQDGPYSELTLNLQPNATGIFETRGDSNPLATGFMRVQLDKPETSGLAIFKYDGGREASVLPSYPGKQFALFVERGPGLDTGIAISRTGTEPVTLALYDANGVLQATQEFIFDKGDAQQARFVSEAFSLPERFRGTLIMTSEGEFATIGLRFGGKALSTIPVTRIK
jgi:hypothetical protein